MKKIVIVLILGSMPAAAQFLPSPCFTLTGPCAGELTSVLSKTELILHTAHWVTALADMARNSVRQGGLSPSNAVYELAALDNLLRSGAALTQATPSIQRWDAVFVPPVQRLGTGTYYSDYQTWARATSDTLRAVQLAGQLSHSQTMGVAAQIHLLEQFIGLINGRLQSGMTTAAASAQTAAGVSKLHDTVMSGNAMQATFMQYQMQKEMRQQDMEQQYFAPTTVPRDNKGF